jgi:hypothetical protein
VAIIKIPHSHSFEMSQGSELYTLPLVITGDYSIILNEQHAK